MDTNPLLDLKTRFASYLRNERERAERSIKLFLLQLRRIEESTGKNLADVTADDLRAVRDEMREAGYSSCYVKSRVVAMRSFHKWGVLEGLWPANGILMMPTPREESDSSPPLPVEKARVVLNSCEGSLETRVIYLGLYAGCRIGESAAITDEGWQDGWLHFRHQKSRLPAEIPVHPALKSKQAIILEHPTPHKEALQKAKQRVEKRVGFPFKSHQLRKCFASSLFDANVPDRVVKALLGHKQDVTGLYITVSQRKRIEAIRALPY